MSADRTTEEREELREVVLGCHSKVWRAASSNPEVSHRFKVAIGHDDVAGFQFSPDDRVWVFSYSRIPEENARLLTILKAAAVREVVYVSSASTIVTRLTRCYKYPRVKQQAEDEARRRLNARVLTLGLVYDDVSDLPSGINAATSQKRLNEFLLSPHWPEESGTRMRLFEFVSREFRGGWEVLLHRLYGGLQSVVRSWPCILRPLDFLLRAIGIRWYGYIYLSNRLWISMRS